MMRQKGIPSMYILNSGTFQLMYPLSKQKHGRVGVLLDSLHFCGSLTFTIVFSEHLSHIGTLRFVALFNLEASTLNTIHY